MTSTLQFSDSLRGQRRKLKNRWSDNLWTVVHHIANDVSMYKVRSTKTGQMKILNRARLLLSLANFEDKEGIEVNIIRLDDGASPSTMLETPSLQDAESGVPPGLHYSLNLAIVTNNWHQ